MLFVVSDGFFLSNWFRVYESPKNGAEVFLSAPRKAGFCHNSPWAGDFGTRNPGYLGRCCVWIFVNIGKKVDHSNGRNTKRSRTSLSLCASLIKSPFSEAFLWGFAGISNPASGESGYPIGGKNVIKGNEIKST